MPNGSSHGLDAHSMGKWKKTYALSEWIYCIRRLHRIEHHRICARAFDRSGMLGRNRKHRQISRIT